ncbi:amidohydrolase family protein [Neiella marina]|uniref:Amidohydrolase family protein n=1 Tax=Neiella holothuriorum TaxID=2870530 RepID=A0ABS7EBR6_9GAMM|nr:amidohydrolase family protein [Neiella holothuriorum]MBW8189767.1 amidohydrolase family protein [Neiella holothuriorum]
MKAIHISNIQYLVDGSGSPAVSNAVGVNMRIVDGVIEAVGESVLAKPGDEHIDATGLVMYPGWVNTHHHLFQSVLKGLSIGINERLFGWLNHVTFPRVGRVTEQALRAGVRLGLAELLLSGTTTCADHHYIYHQALDPLMADLLFEEADQLGMRLVLCRGGQLKEHVNRQYPSRTKPETMAQYQDDIKRLTEHYHQPQGDAMRRIVVAPNTPTFSMTPDELASLADFSRSLGLRMHSHLSETENYVEFCQQTHGCLPVEFVARHGWLGDDVWFAHMVHVAEAEFELLGETKTGIAHCPASNGRLGSGIAPIWPMQQAGATISIGVDGAASNEQASMLAELRLAWLMQRAVTRRPDQITIEQVIHWGSAGGAKVLGLDSIGTLAPGMAADLALYRLDQLSNIGLHEPVYGPIACGQATPALVMCQGRVVVKDGQIPNLDLAQLKRMAADAVALLA